MRNIDPKINPGGRLKPRQFDFKKILPFIIIGGFALVIASKEIPGFYHALEYYVAHDRWQAGESCNNKAMKLGTRSDFMRIIQHGDIHTTEKGFLIKNIIVGEMAKSGGEQRFVVDCYTDSIGNLVRADRRDL